MSLTPNIIKIPTSIQNVPIPVKTQNRDACLDISKITVVPKIEDTPPITFYYKNEWKLNYIGIR